MNFGNSLPGHALDFGGITHSKGDCEGQVDFTATLFWDASKLPAPKPTAPKLEVCVGDRLVPFSGGSFRASPSHNLAIQD